MKNTSNNKPNNKNNTSWGGVAPWYNDLLEGKDGGKGNDKSSSGTYQSDVILPNLLRLVEPKKGVVIADIACGQGFFSREFAKKGAKLVSSDIAPELIAFAEEKNDGEKLNIEYHTSPASNLNFIKSESVDKAVIVLAIQNIEDANKVWNEAFRILKKGGELHLVLNHPAFRIPKASSWGFDTEEKQYRRVDAYLTERKEIIDMNPGAKKNTKQTISFHRPLQWYFKTLTNSGFLISRLEEWISNRESDNKVRGDEENRMRKEIPMFLYLQARK